jgi:hypothetical protein
MVLGRDSLDVLPFLLRMQEIANEARVPEGVALRLLPDTLTEPALTAYRTSKPASYPAAVRWLLLAYAPEAEFAETCRELQTIWQEYP